MRNYIKLRTLRLYYVGHEPTFYVVFGGSDKDLLFYSNRLQALIREEDPAAQFAIAPPLTCWFELNQANLSKLVNLNSGDIWTRTRLNNIFLFDGENLYEMTRVEAEGSPRKTWSHGH